jgi:hypothetical protein
MEEIDDYIDRWHDQPDGTHLHDFLGMTSEEYALWLRSPDSLALILTGRKLNKSLDELASEDLRSMRLAARTDDASRVKRLDEWLRRRKSTV